MSTLSQFYPNARHLFARGSLSWMTGTYKILLMAAGYTPDFTAANLSDLPAGQIVATSPGIANPTEALGVLSGDTVAFGPITDPRQVGSLIFFKDTGTPSTSPLLAYVDTPDVAGFPAVLAGFAYYVYKNVIGGWFRL